MNSNRNSKICLLKHVQKKKKVKLKSQTQIIPIQTDTRSSGGPSQGLKGALAPQIFEKN